jgi:hypothetical protein
MADNPRRIANPGEFAGVILEAARIHADTNMLWRMIGAEADRIGVRYGADMFGAVTRMRSGSTAMAYGSERLSVADRNTALDRSFIGRQPYAALTRNPGAVPVYDVRFELTTTQGMETSTSWKRLRYTGQLPATVGALMEDIEALTVVLGDRYAVSTGDIGTILIGEV